MNPDNDSFEHLLKAQPIRKIPKEWRDGILRPEASSPAAWPGPRAWKALAACWVVIVGLQALTQSPTESQALVTRSTPPASHEFEQTTYQLAWAVIRPKNQTR